MVNEETSTKYKVIQILRNNAEPVSGEAIAEQVAVSRVAVWKAVQALQSAGYGITSTKNGYQLTKDVRDSLYPWEFGKEESLFVHFAETESTMIEARRIAEAEEADGTQKTQIITADHQTKGKGQSNHSWTTTEGSLAYTIVTHNHIPTAESHRVTMAAQVALAQVLTQSAGRPFYVRWPNDVWSAEGKVAGILDELSATGNICRWVNIGIGVNVSSHPPIPLSDCVLSGEQSTSLQSSKSGAVLENNTGADCKNNYLTRKELLSLFWNEFQKQQALVLSDSNELTEQWNTLCCDVGKKVKVRGDYCCNSNGAARGNSQKQDGEFIFKKINGWGWAVFTECGSRKEILLPPGTISFVKQKGCRF